MLPDTLDRIIQSVNNKMFQLTKPLQDQMRLVSSELNDLESEQRQLFQQFESGALSATDFSSTLQNLKAQRKACLEEKERRESELSNHSQKAISAEKIKAAISQLHKLFDLQDEDRQKQLIRLLVDKIIIPQDRDLTRAVIYGSPALFNIQIPITTEEPKS